MKNIAACILFIFCALQLSAQKPAQKITYKKYADDQKGVSISYPANWNNKPYQDYVFRFMRPVEQPGQKFCENIILATGPAQDLYLIEYLEDARKKMKESMEGFRELKSVYTKIDGLDFVRMEYQFTNRTLTLHSVLYLTIKNDKAYSLNCSALSTTFDKYSPMFETVARSFRIK